MRAAWMRRETRARSATSAIDGLVERVDLFAEYRDHVRAAFGGPRRVRWCAMVVISSSVVVAMGQSVRADMTNAPGLSGPGRRWGNQPATTGTELRYP